jgi:MOSC domain-containing protein YiiM
MMTSPEEATDSPATVRALFAGPIRALRSARVPGGPITAWRSAILKTAIEAPILVGPLGLEGDAQKEKKHHGGPMKAVLIYGAAHYAMWDETLRPHAHAHHEALRGMSADVDASAYGFGAFGENLTVEGLTEQNVYLGDVWQVGACVLQISEPRGPCATLTRRWMRPALLADVTSTAAAGWYNAVREPGLVRAGDTMRLLERVQQDWSMARVFTVLEQRVSQRDDIRALHEAPFVHEPLRERLARRLSTPGRIRD